jgi:hypothetical protein
MEAAADDSRSKIEAKAARIFEQVQAQVPGAVVSAPAFVGAVGDAVDAVVDAADAAIEGIVNVTDDVVWC